MSDSRSLPDERTPALLVGQRVQVFNPGPKDTGVIMGGETHRYIRGMVRVEWDDGTESWSLTRLLRPIGCTADA